jgi:hypothetical protein
LTQVELVSRASAMQAAHATTLGHVEGLVREQAEVSKRLNGGISDMQSKGTELEKVGLNDGWLARISRLVSRRGEVLARRSISEALVKIHEKSVLDTQRASAVADNLKRCAAELHLGVADLHQERATALQNMKAGAEHVLVLEDALEAAEASDLAGPELTQRVDGLEFDERVVSAEVALLRAHAALCDDEIEAASALRDTVQSMYEDMSKFVMNAGQAVSGAGRKIQALGMAADAATVVLELNASMEELDVAMVETSAYLAQADELLTRVLPDLNARLSATDGTRRLTDNLELKQIGRDRARALADQALREAAEAEVDQLSEG